MPSIKTQREKDRRQQRIAAGLCPIHADPVPLAPGRSLCEKCLEKRAGFQRSYSKDVRYKRIDRKYRISQKFKSLMKGKYAGSRGVLDAVKLHYGCQNPTCPCGKQKLPSYALDFHHLVGVKRFNLGNSCRGRSLRVIIEEVKKCTILCAVCHRLEKWGDLDCSGLPLCQLNENGVVEG